MIKKNIVMKHKMKAYFSKQSKRKTLIKIVFYLEIYIK